MRYVRLEAYQRLFGVEAKSTVGIEASLPSTFTNAMRGFSKDLAKIGGIRPRAFVVEYLATPTDLISADEIARALHGAMTATETKIDILLLVVSNPVAITKNVFLMETLTRECRQRSLTLGYAAEPDGFRCHFLVKGRYLPPGELHTEVVPRPAKIVPIPAAEINSLLGIVNGHFHVIAEGHTRCVSAFASAARLGSRQDLLLHVKSLIAERLGGKRYSVCPYGLPGSMMPDLAQHLLDHDGARLLKAQELPEKGEGVVLVSDFNFDFYKMGRDASYLREKGVGPILTLALARISNGDPVDLALIDADYAEGYADADACRLCARGSVPVLGESVGRLKKAVSNFDPVDFWDLIAQDQAYRAVGHWPSDLTPNHYYFRILAAPIFERHGFSIALRMINALGQKGVLPEFVTRIVCPEDNGAAVALSRFVALHYRLAERAVIPIPRQFLRTVAGGEIGDELRTYLRRVGDDCLAGQNVVVVDQAAHHFRTLSALKSVCQSQGARVLGIAVFVDRTSNSVEFGELLHDCHYVSLYAWPCVPRRLSECQCTSAMEAR